MRKKIKKTNIIYLIAIIMFIGLVATFISKHSYLFNDDLKELNAISFINITPKEAKQRLEMEKGVILLDVRTKDEYDSGHLKESILIPVDKLEAEVHNKLTDKNTPIFVYCRSGNRSVTASKILVELGYRKVYNLGGIIDWPYEVVK